MNKSIVAKPERYCEIRCKSLEDIRDTCTRHIKNAQLMLLGRIDAEDLTDTDAFYLDMQERMWYDLLEDVTAMLNKEKERMTDTERLELAAKAAGYSFDGYVLRNTKTGFEYAGWNPLEDDGDAFRLAVKLSIPFRVFYGQNTVIAYGKKTNHFTEGKDEIMSFTDNPNESTRRAIVLVASEIGKTMT